MSEPSEFRSHFRLGHVLQVSIALLIAMTASCTDERTGDLDPGIPDTTAQPVSVHAGMLVFRDHRALHETLSQLERLDAESLQRWNRDMGVVTLREVFDRVVAAESALDEHYERLLAQDGSRARIPATPVHSDAYIEALRLGQLRLVADADGEYFDYAVRDKHLAPVLDVHGRVAVGGIVLQHTPDGARQVAYPHAGALDEALAALPHAAVRHDVHAGIAVELQPGSGGSSFFYIPKNRADWTYSAIANNSWSVHDRRRYRAYVEGYSYRLWDAQGRQELYVRNVLRIEGMKKNIFGSWGYRETYYASVNMEWYWDYLWGDYYYSSLPVPSSTNSAPLSWSSSYVNNATLALSPHINGYYLFSCTSCSTVEPVILKQVGGSVTINGVTLYPGSYANVVVQ